MVTLRAWSSLVASVRTWHIEAAVVAAVLLVVAFASGASGVEFIGAGAVQLGFMHGQIADRLHEAHVLPEGTGAKTHAVECARWMWRYWCAKEVLWIAYFVVHESYAALAGAGVFLAYPLWRRLWRSGWPCAGKVRP